MLVFNLVQLPACTCIKVEELRRDLRIKSQELEAKNAAANDKLKKMVKDQQEAEKKKVCPGRLTQPNAKYLTSCSYEYFIAL